MNRSVIKYLILNLICSIFFNYGHPVTPTMLMEKGSPDFLFGLLFMCMSIGMLVSSPYWGSLIDKYGTKSVMIISNVGYAVGQIIFCYAQNPYIMLGGRIFAGIFAAAWIVAINSYINAKVPEATKARVFGYILVTSSVGGMIGQLSSGYIGRNNYQNSFNFQIIGLLLFSLVSVFLLDAVKVKVVPKAKLNLKRMHEILKEEKTTPILVGVVALTAVNTLFTTTLTYFLVQELQYPSTAIGTFNSFISLTALVSNLFLIGFIEQRFSFFKGYFLQFLIAFSGFGLIVYFLTAYYNELIANYNFLLYATITLIGVGTALCLPFVQKRVVKNAKNSPNELLGIIQSFKSLGMIIGSLSQSILYTISPIYAFMMIGVLLTIGLIFVIIAKVQEKNINLNRKMKNA